MNPIKILTRFDNRCVTTYALYHDDNGYSVLITEFIEDTKYKSKTTRIDADSQAEAIAAIKELHRRRIGTGDV